MEKIVEKVPHNILQSEDLYKVLHHFPQHPPAPLSLPPPQAGAFAI